MAAAIHLRQFPGQVLVEHFDFIHQARASWIVANLDGLSGNGDEWRYLFRSRAAGFMLDAPHVFNLAQFPAQALLFMPQESIFSMGLEYENRWALVRDETGIDTLAFQSTVFWPARSRSHSSIAGTACISNPGGSSSICSAANFQAGAANLVSRLLSLDRRYCGCHWGLKPWSA